MNPGSKKMLSSVVLVVLATSLDLSYPYSPTPIFQLVIAFALAIAGAFVGVRGIFDFLSERL